MGRPQNRRLPNQLVEERGQRESWLLYCKCRWMCSLRSVLPQSLQWSADLNHAYCFFLLQVASHLHPRDILHLARATKHFNGMLMSKDSRPVWRAAFQNVDAPECPNDLSEPLYAALLYDRTCMVRKSYAVVSCLAETCPSAGVWLEHKMRT